MKLFAGNIEESILDFLLAEGSCTTGGLHEHAFRTHGCTKQGFYRALRKLRKDEKVIMYKSTVSIHNVWKERLRRALEGRAGESLIGDPTKLNHGDTLSVRLTGLSSMDQLWGHLFVAIERKVPAKRPLYLFNPHNWSALLRTEADKIHEESLRETGRPVYLLIGSDSELDKAATAHANFKHLEYSFRPHSEDMYAAAIGDYVIELTFSKATRDAIGVLFKKGTDVEKAKEKLRQLDTASRSHVVIEKNPSRAKQWKRRIATDFFIPKKFRDF